MRRDHNRYALPALLLLIGMPTAGVTQQSQTPPSATPPSATQQTTDIKAKAKPKTTKPALAGHRTYPAGKNKRLPDAAASGPRPKDGRSVQTGVFNPWSAPIGKGSKSSAKAAVTKTEPAKETESVLTVTARANVEVSGRSFTLGEIADLNGGDKALAAQAAAVEVGTSPLPGLSRLLTPGDIIVHLRANRLDMKRVLVVAPPAIRVTCLGTDVSIEQITKAALAAGQDAIKKMPDATLEAVPLAGKVTVPTGKVQYLAGAWRGQPEQGFLSVPVSVMVDNVASQTIEVSLRVRRKTAVLVTVRQIEARAILSAGDVALTPMDLPVTFTQPLTDLKDAIGKRVIHVLPANTPLTASLLETPPAMQANDKILIEYVFGSIHITAPGIARQTGGVGDTIRVYASDTKKDLDAVILDPHTVRIVERDSGDSDDAKSTKEPSHP